MAGLSHESIRANFLPENMLRAQQAMAQRETAQNVSRLNDNQPQGGGDDAALLRAMVARLDAIERNTHRRQQTQARNDSKSEPSQGQAFHARMREQNARKREMHNDRLQQQREQYREAAHERVRARASERARSQARDQRGRFAPATTRPANDPPRRQSRSAVKDMVVGGIRNKARDLADRDPAVRLAMAGAKDAKKLYNHLRGQKKEPKARTPIRSTALKRHTPKFSALSTAGPLGPAAQLGQTSANTGPGDGQNQGMGLGSLAGLGKGRLAGLAAGAGRLAAAAALPVAAGVATHMLDYNPNVAGNSTIGNWINQNVPGAMALDNWVYDATGGLIGTSRNDPRLPQNNPNDPAFRPQPGTQNVTPPAYTLENPLNTKADLSGAKSSDLMRATYDAFRRQGLSDQGARAMVGEINRENSFQSRYMFGSHTDDANGARNSGMISWQGDRSDAMMAALKAGGHIGPDGKIMQTQAAIDAQVGFMMSEMESGRIKPRDPSQLHGKALVDYLKSENVDPQKAMDAVGTNYIKWAIDNPRYRNDGLRNRQSGYDAISGILNTERPGGVTTTPRVTTPVGGDQSNPGALPGSNPLVTQNQMTQAAIRKDPIQQILQDRLQFAAEKTGLEVDIGSGGQMSLQEAIAKGARQVGKQWVLPDGTAVRTGSTRHDDGGAADLKLYVRDPETGQRRALDMSNPADAAKMEEFTRQTVRAGATGVGAGPGYMGNQTLHIGGGNPASWGGAEFIERARQSGVQDQEAGLQEFEAWKKAREEAVKAGQTVATPNVVAEDFHAGHDHGPNGEELGVKQNNPFTGTPYSREDGLQAIQQQMIDARIKAASDGAITPALPYTSTADTNATPTLPGENKSLPAFASLLGANVNPGEVTRGPDLAPVADATPVLPEVTEAQRNAGLINPPTGLTFPSYDPATDRNKVVPEMFAQPTNTTTGTFSKDFVPPDSSKFTPTVQTATNEMETQRLEQKMIRDQQQAEERTRGIPKLDPANPLGVTNPVVDNSAIPKLDPTNPLGVAPGTLPGNNEAQLAKDAAMEQVRRDLIVQQEQAQVRKLMDPTAMGPTSTFSKDYVPPDTSGFKRPPGENTVQETKGDRIRPNQVQQPVTGFDPSRFGDTPTPSFDPSRFGDTPTPAFDPSRFGDVTTPGFDPSRFGMLNPAMPSMLGQTIDHALGAPVTQMADSVKTAMATPTGIATSMSEFATGLGTQPGQTETQTAGITEPAFNPVDFSGVNQPAKDSGSSTRVATAAGDDKLRITEVNTMDEISMGMVNGMEIV